MIVAHGHIAPAVDDSEECGLCYVSRRRLGFGDVQGVSRAGAMSASALLRRELLLKIEFIGDYHLRCHDVMIINTHDSAPGVGGLECYSSFYCSVDIIDTGLTS